MGPRDQKGIFAAFYEAALHSQRCIACMMYHIVSHWHNCFDNILQLLPQIHNSGNICSTGCIVWISHIFAVAPDYQRGSMVTYCKQRFARRYKKIGQYIPLIDSLSIFILANLFSHIEIDNLKQNTEAD